MIETLYLGDLIHTLPLLQAVRRRYPKAKLDVLVRAPHVGLIQQVDGVDEVLAMDAAQHRGPRGIWKLCQLLRSRRYDLVLNPGASDRATVLTALSGGKRRLGRLNRNQSRRLWPLLHDEVIDTPYGAEPMFWQKLQAFRQPLQLDGEVRFGVDTTAVDVLPLKLPAAYIHVSPFASEDIRCLPPATVVTLLQALRVQHSDHGLVVTAGPSPRERLRLELIRTHAGLEDIVFLPGSLDLPTLAAVISGAALHIGPDSGPLHLAYALGVPAVACFLYKDASAEWMPLGASYRTVGISTRLQGGLYGLSLSFMLEAAQDLLPSR